MDKKKKLQPVIKKSGWQVRGVLLLICVVGVLLYVPFHYFRDRTDCKQWLYYRNLDVKVDSVNDAIRLFRPWVRTENYYKNHDFPDNLEAIQKKYNVVPEEHTFIVRNSMRKYESITAYDMILAYLIDHNGKIYKYKMCGFI